MKKSIYTLAIAALSSSAFAQTLQDAITKTGNERYDAAAADLRALIAKDATKGEYYYYMGENYLRNGLLDKDPMMVDSANIFYSKGVEVNATNPLNYVGLGKVLLYKGNMNDAKAQFFKAGSVAQNKNAEVMRETAEAWLIMDTKNPDEALTQINNAIKLDPKNSENYILLGDAQLEKNPTDGSVPIKSYQQATTLNPKSAKGILREGKLYQRGRNYQLALDKYNAALAIEPNFGPAYREIAELYFLAGKNSKSIENWKKYLELNNSAFAHYRFMSALYKNKSYTESVQEFETVKKTNFQNPYLYRIAGMSYYEMGDKVDKDAYTKGLSALSDFFIKAGTNFKYLPTDYKYKGLLMMKTGKDSLGILELEKAAAMDTSLTGDMYSEIANAAYKGKKYDKAAVAYEKKIARSASSMNNNDWFNLGRAYYFPAVAKINEANALKDAKQKAAKEAEAKPLLVKADSAFSNLVRKNPNWAVAYQWRGRVNSLVDPKCESDVTKNMYEKTLSTLKPEEVSGASKSVAVESYEYLGYYYVTKKDKVKSDEMWNKVKELDPENAKAKAYFTPPKQQPVKPK
jgi:tetratricopeptide (TPR) repeat protein